MSVKDLQRNCLRDVNIKKGGASEAPPSNEQGTISALWNIVAERGQEHLVNGLGGNGDSSVVVSRPTHLGNVGILQAPLQPALGPLVELVPEADGAFLDEADVASAA